MSQSTPSYESGIYIPHEALGSLSDEQRHQLVLLLGSLGMEGETHEQLLKPEEDSEPILVAREEFIGTQNNVSSDQSLGIKVWKQLYKTWRITEEVAYRTTNNEPVQSGHLHFAQMAEDLHLRFEPVFIPFEDADTPAYELPEEYMALDITSVRQSLTDGSIRMLRNMGDKRVEFLSAVVEEATSATANK